MNELFVIVVILYLAGFFTISTTYLLYFKTIKKEVFDEEDYMMSGMIGLGWPLILIMIIVFSAIYIIIQLPTLPFRIIDKLSKRRQVDV